jgi:phage-related protein
LASGDIQGDIIYRDKATKALTDVGKASDNTGKKFGGLTKGAALAGAAVAAMAVKFAKDSVEAFKESEQSSKALDVALKKYPKTSDITRASLDKLNTSLAQKTVFDDDSLASGQAVLAQFNLTGKQIQQVTPLLADYASKTGQDIPAAAEALGKAFMGKTRALATVGIAYKSTGDQAKDFTNITELLGQKVGGTAEAMGSTASGKAAILANQYGELQETAGSKLVPALTKLTEIGLKVVDFISRNQAVIVPLVTVLGTVIAAVKAWTIVQAILDAELLANPIGLVVVALAGLAAGLVYAYKHSETFRDVVHAAMHAVAVAVDFVKDHWQAFASALAFLVGGPIVGALALVVTHFGKIKEITGAVVGYVVDKFGDLVDWVGALPGRISHAVRGMFDGIKDSFRAAVNWVISKWNDLSFKIGGGSVFGHDLPSVTIDTPNIPMLAEGGIVTRPTLAMIGEAGPEAVVPLGRRGDAGGSGLPPITINVYGTVVQERDLARSVRNEIAELIRRRGGDPGALGLA